MSIRGHVFFSVKLLLGVGLLGALLFIDDNWRKVIALFQDIQAVYLIPFFGITFFLIWISCLKWHLFLRERGANLSVWRLVVLYIIGLFFNNFFPSNFGGDVVRSYMLGHHIGSRGRAFASVFLERFTGFIAMVSLAVVAFVFSPFLHDDVLVRWSILCVGGATLGLLFILWRPQVLSWTLSPFRRFSIVQNMEAKALRFHSHLSQFQGRPRLIMHAMLYSYVFYVFAAVNVYLAGLLLGIDCSLAQLFVVTPIVMLIASLPLTPNGLGLWEWGYSVYLVSAGATPDQGLAIALALLAKNLIFSLLGGLLFLLEPGLPHRVGASVRPITNTVQDDSMDGRRDLANSQI